MKHCSLVLVRMLCALTLLATGAASAAGPRAAVVVAIDGSGSMLEPKSPDGTPFDQAIAAASLFVAGCDPSIAPGLITFDSAVQILTPRLEPATLERRREQLAVLRRTRASGNTDLLGAVLAALKLLDDTNAPAKWIVLLSDGAQTQGIPADLLRDLRPSSPADAVRSAGKALAARAKAKEVRILTVGLGNAVDRTLLETLAVETGGAFIAVQDASQLLPTYADWLRTIGGYHVARDAERMHTAEGDTDLKVLMALPSARLSALERDGKAVEPGAAGFESWTDGRRLHVWQSGQPAAGTYHLRFKPDRGKDDFLVFLKRSPQRWDVRLKYLPGNPTEPLRVEVRGTPAPAPGQAFDANLIVTDPQGKETERPLKLGLHPDGTLAGEFKLDGAGEAGTNTVRVRLRDQSGWETQHVQTVRFEPAAPIDLRVNVNAPRGLALSRGQKGTLTWELRLDSDVPVGEVEAKLTWVPASPSAPQLRLTGAANGTTVRVPLAAMTRVPLSIDVPAGAALGVCEASLTLRVVGERPITLNGVPSLTLPVTFRVEPPLVHIQLLDGGGRPLPNNVCTHRVLSPVAARVDELHFRLVGDAGTDDWQVRLIRAEVDGVRCAFDLRCDGLDHMVVRLNIPAQAAPGVRSFPFDIEPGTGIRLTEDSRQFRVDLEIPDATITLATPAGRPIEIRHRLGYLDWLRLNVLGQPAPWEKRVTLTGKASGLDEGVPWCITGMSPGAQGLGEEDTANGRRSWNAALSGEVMNTGDYPVRAEVACPYRHLQFVDAEGTSLPREDGQVVVGKVHILSPSLLPPVLIVMALTGLIIVDQLRRRRVPGQLFAATAVEAALGGQRRPVRLGRKHHRIVLGGQVLEIRRRWGSVQVRWVSGQADEVAVVLTCPGGHERYLRPGGAWESLCNDDTVRVGADEAKYLAPVTRHCQTTLALTDSLLF